MHTCGTQGSAIHLNADVAAGASRTRSHDKGVRGVNSCGQTIIVVSSCERFMIVTFESQNVTNVQQCVTVLFRVRNEWRSICHFCFRGCVYHCSNSAPKKSGVSFRHEPSDFYATGRLFLICCNTSARWDPRHGQCMSESTTVIFQTIALSVGLNATKLSCQRTPPFLFGSPLVRRRVLHRENIAFEVVSDVRNT